MRGSPWGSSCIVYLRQTNRKPASIRVVDNFKKALSRPPLLILLRSRGFHALPPLPCCSPRAPALRSYEARCGCTCIHPKCHKAVHEGKAAVLRRDNTGPPAALHPARPWSRKPWLPRRFAVGRDGLVESSRRSSPEPSRGPRPRINSPAPVLVKMHRFGCAANQCRLAKCAPRRASP